MSTPSTPSSQIESDLWQEFRSTRRPDLRDALIVRHMPLVEPHARRLQRQNPAYPLDDLRSAGMVGLIAAVDRFDPARGVPFRTFAATRIRGAIVDQIREEGWLPRVAQARGAAVLKKRDELRQVLEHEPTDGELCEAMAMSDEIFAAALAESRCRVMRPAVDAFTEGNAAGESTLETKLLSREPEPSVAAADRDTVRMILGPLDDRARLVVKLYVLEGLNTPEIGRQLGYTKSRILQILHAALAVLRSRPDRLESLA